jgi:hypothetical protein
MSVSSLTGYLAPSSNPTIINGLTVATGNIVATTGTITANGNIRTDASFVGVNCDVSGEVATGTITATGLITCAGVNAGAGNVATDVAVTCLNCFASAEVSSPTVRILGTDSAEAFGFLSTNAAGTALFFTPAGGEPIQVAPQA